MLPWDKFEKTLRSVLSVKRDDLFEEVLEAARQQQVNGTAVEKKGRRGDNQVSQSVAKQIAVSGWVYAVQVQYVV